MRISETSSSDLSTVSDSDLPYPVQRETPSINSAKIQQNSLSDHDSFGVATCENNQVTHATGGDLSSQRDVGYVNITDARNLRTTAISESPRPANPVPALPPRQNRGQKGALPSPTRSGVLPKNVPPQPRRAAPTPPHKPLPSQNLDTDAAPSDSRAQPRQETQEGEKSENFTQSKVKPGRYE